MLIQPHVAEMRIAASRASISRRCGGFTLLEVLITIVILAFGLLGLVGLQTRMQLTETESYQRAQAVMLLSDMAERMTSNRTVVSQYGADGATVTLGTGVDDTANCAIVTAGPARDMCEWSQALKGASETKGGNNVGAMIGARGCIEQLQAADAPTCTPAIYRITVAWQGLQPTVSPALTCAKDSYGANDALRRAIPIDVVMPQLSCIPS
jgi:type IV pilus assembly protein PilV